MVTDELTTREIVNVIVVVIAKIMATLITMVTQIIIVVIRWIAVTTGRIARTRYLAIIGIRAANHIYIVVVVINHRIRIIGVGIRVASLV